MAKKEIYFNHDGSAIRKLQVLFKHIIFLIYSMSMIFCWIRFIWCVFKWVFKAGVDMVAELVGVTLGPKGRNVVLQNKYGPPKIVNDGETVLKEVYLYFPNFPFPFTFPFH